jgi:hypothetical protein
MEEMEDLLRSGEEALEAARGLEKTIDSLKPGTKLRQQLIDSWFKLRNASKVRRQKLIVLVDKYYQIPLPEGVSEPEYDPKMKHYGSAFSNGTIKIGTKAFESLPVLVTTKLHELTHGQQAAEGRWPRKSDKKALAMVEIEAYQHELDNAELSGISDAEIEAVEKARDDLIATLDSTNAKRVKAKKYTAEAILLEDAEELGDVKVEWEGRGRAAGDVFKVKLTPLKRKNFTIEIIRGTVVSPNVDDVQRIMLAETTFVNLKEQPEEIVLSGYCLDPEKSPPPEPEKSITPSWTLSSPLQTRGPERERLERSKSIIESGQELAKAGRYNDALGAKHQMTVIQRAIWCDANPEWNKERLKEDLKKQLAEAGHEVPEEALDEKVDDIWSDVDLTLKHKSADG